MKLVLLLFLLSVSNPITAQTLFFESAESSDEFAPVVRGYSPRFPSDHAAHPDFRLEWWYLTANLSDDEGRQWGLQWTLFRQALDAGGEPEGWSSNQMWMGHAAISTPDGHFHEQRFSRGGIGQAGVELTNNQFNAWIDDWSWQSNDQNMFPATLDFSVQDFELSMNLQTTGPFVRHGEQGYSQKSAGKQASYYYSMPFIEISGTVTVDDEPVPLSGQGWLDREWSSEPLSDQQTGWDWFSLHLDSGDKLMVYRLREQSGDHWLSGSWIRANGEITYLKRKQITIEEVDVRTLSVSDSRIIELPLDWRIGVPELDLQLQISPLFDRQWMATAIAYWEGIVIARDANGRQLGRGYMELTGYDR